jgi:hypothetical protein
MHNGYVNQPATPDFLACSSAEDAPFVCMLYVNTAWAINLAIGWKALIANCASGMISGRDAHG